MEFDLARLQPKERASFALRALYEAAGCRKYHMGRFEEYGLYQENRSFLSSEQVITFTDLDGRLLALKPDVTLSIAKTAQPAPGETLKYYYHENVYRPSAESHTFKEISQMGLELLGEVKEPEVRQTVCLAAQSLEQMGQPWVLEISHMGYLFGLFDALGVPEAARPGLLETLRAKNIHELRAAAKAAGLSDADANALTALLSLSGEYAVALPKAAALCRNTRMEAAVAELNALAEPLAKAGGSIRLDGRELAELPQWERTGLVGYLGHDPELFSGTIRENVLLGDTGDPMDYLRAVCLDGEVAAMTEGLETRVGTGGVRLSGGQAQRLALARTLAHQRPLLILDDPFSALDRATETEIFAHLRRLAADSVVILISHRLYLFPELDRVIWLENGEAKVGTHEELEGNTPDYAAQFDAQRGEQP